MSGDDRTTYIGGPGAAAILGVNPYMTQVDLWMQLTKRAPPVEQTPEMRSGLRLERAVLEFAAEKLGRAVLPGPFVRDARLPLGGHLDGITDGAPELIEAKTIRSTARRKLFGAPMTAEIPPDIIAQTLHYMGLVPELRVAWVPVLFSGLEFEMYGAIERNDQLIEQMRNICWRWWQDYILTDMPPPPQTGADAAALFPRDSGAIVIADDATREAVARLHDVRRERDLLESEEEQLEGRIKLALGSASTLSDGSETLATWKTTKPSFRFDQAAFKENEPALYKSWSREYTSRRFLLK